MIDEQDCHLQACFSYFYNVQVKTGYRDILNMAFPVMVGSIATTLLNITDSAFLGRIGEAELGASAIGGILYFVFVMIGISIGTGAQILIARRAGEKDHPAIGSIFDHSLLLLAGLSVLLFFILQVPVPSILRLAIADQHVLDATLQFINYRSYGIFFIMAATAFRSFFVGIAQTKIYGYYAFIMAGVNIILGYGFIFGHWGFPDLGIAGAGIASSLAEAIALLFLLLWLATRKGINEFGLFKFRRFDKSLVAVIVNLSLPLVVQNLLSMVAWLVFFLFIEKLGKHELAISNIVRGAYMIAMTPIWGFSVAANSMVSNVIGQDRKDDVIRLVNRILFLSFITTLVMGCLLLLFTQEILGIFTVESDLISHSLGSYHIVVLSLFFFATAIVLISAVSGTGATKMALYIEIIAILLYMVYIYYTTFISKSRVEIVWLSELVYWTFIGGAAYLYLWSNKWKSIRV